MEWEGREESTNVEDRRGIGPGGGLAIGGVGALIMAFLAMIFGGDPSRFVGRDPDAPGNAREADAEDHKMARFTRVVLRDTEVVWEEQFRRMGKEYRKPTLVMFNGVVQSACGTAESAVGPFYCPADSKIYIDLSFYRDMQRKLNAPGEFARAYVIAHEVGHHVQRLLGYSQRVEDARRYRSKVEANRMSVRLELQADFLAGVWAHHGQKKFKFLEKGDIESALKAAFEIGDDRLQKRARGHVVPDSFTHGTSQQRMRWFKKGFETGDVSQAGLLFDLKYNEL